MRNSLKALVLATITLALLPVSGNAQTAISSLTSATGTNNFDNGNDGQGWSWNALTNGPALDISSNGTDAVNGSYGQTLLGVYLQGANTNNNVSSAAISAFDYHSGTGTYNYGVNAAAQNGTHNFGVYGQLNASAGNAGDAGVWGSAQGTTGATYGVLGTNASPTGYAGYFNNSGSGYAAAFMGGGVGIGTATPQSLVHAYGGEVQVGSSGSSCASANGGAIRFSSSTLYYCDGTSTWQTVSNSGSGKVTSSSAGQIAYYQNTGTTVIGTSTMNIANGNVGIGTSTPASALDVWGTLSIDGTQIAASNLQNGVTGSGSVALAISPTFTGTPVLSTATATAPAQGNSSSSVITSAWYGQNLPGGLINKFRNGTIDVWQRGTSSLATSTTGAYTADGWRVKQTGAAFTCSQDTGTAGTLYSLKCVGGASNTDTVFSQRIESYIAAPLAGNTITVQFRYKQNSGSAVTPKISTCYASAQDNFATCTSDLSATSLTSCASGSWCTESYTLSASASASQGYEVDLDCNTALTSAQSCWMTAADVRVTPGVSTGVNSTPPPAELRPIFAELPFNQRYYEKSYEYATAPGTAAGVGSVYFIGYNGTGNFGGTVWFKVQKCAVPTVSYWDQSGNASKVNTDGQGANQTASLLFPNQTQFIMYVTLNNPGAMSFQWVANAEL